MVVVTFGAEKPSKLNWGLVLISNNSSVSRWSIMFKCLAELYSLMISVSTRARDVMLASNDNTETDWTGLGAVRTLHLSSVKRVCVRRKLPSDKNKSVVFFSFEGLIYVCDSLFKDRGWTVLASNSVRSRRGNEYLSSSIYYCTAWRAKVSPLNDLTTRIYTRQHAPKKRNT